MSNVYRSQNLIYFWKAEIVKNMTWNRKYENRLYWSVPVMIFKLRLNVFFWRLYWRHLSRILSSDLTSDHSHHHLLNWWIQYSKRIKSFCLYILLLKKSNCFQCFQRDPALRSGGIAARCLGDKWGSDKLFMRFQEVRLLFIFLRILRIENYKCIFNEDLYFYQYIY